jgi:hypothetical protein
VFLSHLIGQGEIHPVRVLVVLILERSSGGGITTRLRHSPFDFLGLRALGGGRGAAAAVVTSPDGFCFLSLSFLEEGPDDAEDVVGNDVVDEEAEDDDDDARPLGPTSVRDAGTSARRLERERER